VNLTGGEAAEEREDDPGADHLPPVTSDDVRETSQHPFSLRCSERTGFYRHGNFTATVRNATIW